MKASVASSPPSRKHSSFTRLVRPFARALRAPLCSQTHRIVHDYVGAAGAFASGRTGARADVFRGAEEGLSSTFQQALSFFSLRLFFARAGACVCASRRSGECCGSVACWYEKRFACVRGGVVGYERGARGQKIGGRGAGAAAAAAPRRQTPLPAPHLPLETASRVSFVDALRGLAKGTILPAMRRL